MKKIVKAPKVKLMQETAMKAKETGDALKLKASKWKPKAVKK